MSNQQHPITPPPELVREWQATGPSHPQRFFDYFATQAARWGADAELEACCDWIEREIGHGREWGAELRAVRRPKPPSLAEQAMEAQQRAWNGSSTHADWELIRAALQRLQKLEQQLD